MQSESPRAVSPPRLETARLILDVHGRANFAPLAAMWADPETTRHIGAASTPQESWGRLLRYRGLWPLLGFGYWAVREAATGRFVGDVGFADFHRSPALAIGGVAEAGWVLAAWAHGRGFAQEAMTAALGWLDAQPQHDRSCCLIHPANGPSLRLAARLGYVVRPVPAPVDTVLVLTRGRPGAVSAAVPASSADAPVRSAIPLR